MSHFYAGISGQAGEATRTGSKNSGASAYAQGWQARGSARVWHDADADTDQVSLHLGRGPDNHTGGSLSVAFGDAATVVNALALDDPKIAAIVRRLHAEADKLNTEAPRAIKRARRARAAQA